MIITQFHIFLLVAVMLAIFYVGFICGNYDRRMPREGNTEDGWWQNESSDVEGYANQMQVEIMRKV